MQYVDFAKEIRRKMPDLRRKGTEKAGFPVGIPALQGQRYNIFLLKANSVKMQVRASAICRCDKKQAYSAGTPEGWRRGMRTSGKCRKGQGVSASSCTLKK